jgi:hypothetical protein
MDNHDDLCKAIDESVGKMSNSNIGRVHGLSRMSQQFENDGVHYNETSGRVFLDSILTDADAYFKAELIEIDNEESESVEKYIPAPITAKSFNSKNHSKKPESEAMLGQLGIDGLRRKVNALEEELGKLGNNVERNRTGDILMFARIRDELDAISNSKKEGGGFGKLFLTNSVTLATRVRIDILRAMARQCIKEDETAYVNAYTSRPVLTLKKGRKSPSAGPHFC